MQQPHSTSLARSGEVRNSHSKQRCGSTTAMYCSMYVCETWHMKTSQEKKLDDCDSKCIRKILGIRWRDFITNEEVRTRTKQRPVSSIICKRRLNWLGHVARLPPERLASRVLQWNPQGERRRGRPKMNWRQTIDRDLQMVKRRWNDALRVAC